MTPEQFNEKVNKVDTINQQKQTEEERRYACFMRDMSHAEYVGIENYRKAKELGQNPKSGELRLTLIILNTILPRLVKDIVRLVGNV